MFAAVSMPTTSMLVGLLQGFPEMGVLEWQLPWPNIGASCLINAANDSRRQGN